MESFEYRYSNVDNAINTFRGELVELLAPFTLDHTHDSLTALSDEDLIAIANRRIETLEGILKELVYQLDPRPAKEDQIREDIAALSSSLLHMEVAIASSDQLIQNTLENSETQ